MSSGQEQSPSMLWMQPRGPASLRGNGDGAGGRHLAVPPSAPGPLMAITMGLGCLGTPTSLSSLIAGAHPSLGTTSFSHPSLKDLKAHLFSSLTCPNILSPSSFFLNFIGV